MNKCAKILSKVSLFALAVFLLCYWVGTWNFAIIHNNAFLRFDYAYPMEGSVWKCDSHGLEALVTDNTIGNCMIITDLNTGLKYFMQEGGQVISIIYPYKDNPTLDDMVDSTEVELEFKKRWRKLYKFVIKGVNKDCWYESGNDSISFELVK